MWSRLALSIGLLVPSWACSLLLDTSGIADGGSGAAGGGTAGSSGSGGSTAAGGANAPEGCPWKGGPVPVIAPVVVETGPPRSVCIDATEVTNAQYGEFLADIARDYVPDLPHGACDFKVSFESNEIKNGCDAHHYDLGARKDHPVACVDWCDAHAFCQWAGKRLCGSAEDGGSFEPFTSGPSSEWGAVCTGNGAYKVPWGGNDDYDPPRCNTPCVHEGESGLLDLPVGEDETCVATSLAPEAGKIYDLGGNVSEWMNACQFPADPVSGCAILGDSYQNLMGGDCGGCAYGFEGRSHVAPDIGFRCCSDVE